MGSYTKVLKTVFGALIFLGIIWFLFVGILTGFSTKSVQEVVTVPSTRSLKHWKLIGRDNKHAFQWHSDFNYVSKRRVPNGPDPIHNRRAVKSRQLPTRA